MTVLYGRQMPLRPEKSVFFLQSMDFSGRFHYCLNIFHYIFISYAINRELLTYMSKQE